MPQDLDRFVDRISASSSTSNAFHVPRPTTGNFSPEEGMVHVSILNNSPFTWPRDAETGKHNPAALAPIKQVAWRRVMRVIPSGVEKSRELTRVFGIGMSRLSLDMT